MTTPTNWPNPEQIGVPMFSERDGLHAFSVGDYPGAVAFAWSASSKEFSAESYEAEFTLSPEEIAREYKYIGPCLAPTQISEMLAAERERCAEVCEDNSVSMRTDCKDTETALNEMLETTAREIRNLGAAS